MSTRVCIKCMASITEARRSTLVYIHISLNKTISGFLRSSSRDRINYQKNCNNNYRLLEQ